MLSEFKVTKEDAGLLPIYILIGAIFFFYVFLILIGDQQIQKELWRELAIFTIFMIMIFGSYFFAAIIYAIFSKNETPEKSETVA